MIGYVEAVAEAHEARALDRGVDVEAAGQHHRLVGDDADGAALHAREADEDVAGVIGLQLEEVALVDDLQDQLAHVVGLVRIDRHERVEREIVALGGIGGGPRRRRLAVRGRQEIEEAAQLQQRLDVVLERVVGDARLGRVRDGAAELLVGHVLVGDGLHHVRPGHEHVGRVLHHEDEVGHGRRIDGAAGARPHDQRHLRHHAGGQHIALEHVGIAGQRGDPFLDAGAAGVVDADDGRADLHGLVHDLADLLGMGLAERAAEDREVLAEDEHQPAVDGAMAGDHAVAGDALLAHAEIGRAMLDEHVPLFEGVGIEQELEALARAQLALGVLGLDPALAAALPRGAPLVLELTQDLLHGLPRLLHFYDNRTSSKWNSTAGDVMPARGCSAPQQPPGSGRSPRCRA